MKERIDSERNQGRAPDMGWLDHDRLGFNYRLSELACALGIVQLGRLADMLAARAAAAEGYRQALAGIEELELPCPDADGDRRGWFVFVVQLPEHCGARRGREGAGGEGIQSKPYLPAIHLMSFYRERFGHREGEFPVCERWPGARWRCRSSRKITEAQIERVSRVPASDRGRVAGLAAIHWARVSRLSEPQDPTSSG